MSMRILISDKMSEEGLAHFEGHDGFKVVNKAGIEMDELAEILGEFEALVVRSRTKVTRQMLEKPGKLRIIGRAGAGVDNIDLEAATEKGIIVMNTPGGNTISTAEHAISMMLSLARRIPYADRTMREGKWAKKNIVGTEMFGKTLGIVGLGKIGQVVAERMQAFGMGILAFDPFLTQEGAEKLGVKPASVEEMCAEADVITIHAPKNSETTNLINAERLASMKPGALLINCARGGIVDEEALAKALETGQIAGAALDVFETEPLPEDHKLRTLDNAVLTPHLAASTSEAQEKVAEAIADQIREALSGGIIRNAVNAPTVDGKLFQQLKPVLELCERLGRFTAQFASPVVKSLKITYSGTKAQYPQQPLTTALMKGFLDLNVSETVNEVNALYLAKQLGIRITESRTEDLEEEYAGLISVETENEAGEIHKVSGTLDQNRKPRVVFIDGKHVDSVPEGDMMTIENRDQPGIIGAIGTQLGLHGVNIASMNWGRVAPGGDALVLINLDQKVTDEVLKEIQAIDNVISAKRIQM